MHSPRSLSLIPTIHGVIPGVLAVMLFVSACSTDSSSGPQGADGGPPGISPDGGGASDGGVSPPLTDGAASTTDAATPSKLAPGDSTVTFTVAGRVRQTLVHVPPQYKPGGPRLPLVVALHGNGDTNQNFVKTSNLLASSDTDGFVLVAPAGILQTITVGGQTVPDVSWDAYRATNEGNIDLPLFEELRSRYVGTGAVDPKKVVVYGYSQGGYASFRWALDASSRLSCSAVISAANPFGGGGRITEMTRKIPFALQIGSNDSAAANLRSTKAALEQAGHPVSFVEIAGAGHSPLPGDAHAPLVYCLGQTL